MITNTAAATPATEPPLTTADFDEAGCEALLHPNPDGSYTDLWNNLLNAARVAAAAGRTRHAAVLQSLADACSMMLVPGDLTAPFKPFAIFHDRRSPIPADFNDADIEFFALIASHTAHSGLRARLGDLVWLLEPQRGTTLALAAIADYRSFPIDVGTWRHGVGDCWQRALQLATKLGKTGKVQADEIEAALLVAFDAADKTISFAPLWYSDLLIDRRLSNNQRTQIAVALTLAGQLRSDGGRFEEARQFWESAVRWFKKAGAPADGYRATVAVAEAWVSEALARESMSPPSFAVAASCYEKAIQVYRSVPVVERSPYRGNERMAELRTKLLAAGERSVGELKLLSTPPMDISELINQARARVMNKTPMNSLRGLAMVNRGVVEAEVRRNAELILAKSIFGQLFGSTVVARDGRITSKQAAVGSGVGETERREARLQSQMVRDQQIWMALTVQGGILPALQAMQLEHHLNEQVFVEIARNSPIVPPDRVALFGKGLYAGYCGDFETALHILVPQIENMVRFHLKSAGALTTTLSKEGIDNENGLSNLVKLPEMRVVFGDDLSFEITALYCDPEGPNLRNELAHGLLGDGEGYSIPSVYAWSFVLRIVFIQFWNKARSAAEEATAPPSEPAKT
ncbi:DUF4209 domain-containing protein [Janthinobacterium sp. SUN128]|uniref:DUF4209 domain-containing protein n=1 Tax=Janthinobacterium sp. SUN128 TaxID=3014790 RepID=UPI00271417CD|nr:DUF4209 domain-containing protein [Janthinobacterium sp. SUN128]MDO8036829.1 DUF4209 domain-containing protein [Janthinobacterium sp. SUN128]